MFHRVVHNIKLSSKATLSAWTYQCESILAQRSRRIQQLFSFYHRVYGSQGLQLLLKSYHKQFQPPIKGIMFSAVGAVGFMGFNQVDAASGFNWTRERLSLENFDACGMDIEFIEGLANNKLCPLCKEKQMKYCYCLVGNKKCREKGKDPPGTIRACRKSMSSPLANLEPGNAIITAADESPWEPYFSQDKFSIWKREERSAMYSYKVYARFDDITAEELLHVQTDIDYRRHWDETAITLEMVETDPKPGTNSHLIYWEMMWPRMFSNRDYVYCRRFVRDDLRKVMMVCNRGTTHPKYPQYSNRVRVTDYWSLMVIKPFRGFHEPGVHYILTYYDDPGLPIPQSIKSWVTQKQMPDFLRKMYLATKQYSFRKAVEMENMHKIHMNLSDKEYSPNASRSSWLSRIWGHQRSEGGGK